MVFLYQPFVNPLFASDCIHLGTGRDWARSEQNVTQITSTFIWKISCLCFSILGLLYGAISLPHQIWRESMSQDIKAIYCQRTGCKDLVIKFDLPYWGFGRQFTSGQKLRLPNLIKRKTSKDEMSKKSDNSNSKHILSRPNLRLISTTLLTYDLVWIVQCAAIQLDTSSLTHILLVYSEKVPFLTLCVLFCSVGCQITAKAN